MTSASPDAPQFLPVGLRLQSQRCIVVGGGAVGTRKALTLARAGARVTVVSPALTAELAERVRAGGMHWVEAPFQEEHLAGAFLVVAATDDETMNSAVILAAAGRGALACDASSAERSQVIFGALLEREDVTVAVFTGGRDPAHARRTRDEIAKLLEPDSAAKPGP
ncbi:MAG: bifunctional precorrin-2 dehydrogenase/sirohydrochlorin ferrochelatase [Planctomycetota bacterium]